MGHSALGSENICGSPFPSCQARMANILPAKPFVGIDIESNISEEYVSAKKILSRIKSHLVVVRSFLVGSTASTRALIGISRK